MIILRLVFFYQSCKTFHVSPCFKFSWIF